MCTVFLSARSIFEMMSMFVMIAGLNTVQPILVLDTDFPLNPARHLFSPIGRVKSRKLTTELFQHLRIHSLTDGDRQNIDDHHTLVRPRFGASRYGGKETRIARYVKMYTENFAVSSSGCVKLLLRYFFILLLIVYSA